jgi:UDP-glucuronate 4-epimerase
MFYLVSGGAGFIGSHVCETLLAQGHQVVAVDNFDPYYPRTLKEANLSTCFLSPNFRLIEVDICDPQSLHILAGPYDCIVHLAAKAGVRPSLNDPYIFQSANVLGTQNLLDLARHSRVPQFVFASSSSVYGINPRIPWSEQDNVLLPISPYASTKISGELMGHVYSHLYGIRFMALRLFSVYGPRQRPDLAIRRFAELILEGRSVPVFGDGSSTRDYTYVGDIVDGIQAASAYRGSRYEVINLGNTQTVSLLEMIAILERALGTKATLEEHPNQPGDAPRTYADISKAKALLNYTPKTVFTEGVQQFVEWFKSEKLREESHEEVAPALKAHRWNTAGKHN